MAGRIVYLGNISAQGLVLNLDAAIQGSYPKTGTLWTDISGNNNNGTLTNGPAYTGSDYGAIVFDGVNDFINISSSDTINFGTSNFTSNLWIYPFSASLVGNTEYGVINKNGGFQNSPGWGLELSTYLATAPYPKVYLEGFNSGQTSWGNSNVDGYINTQTWSNINLIRTGTRFDVYINGSPASSKINSNIGLNIDNTTSLTLGKNGSWQSSFKGNISDFSLYNQALTQFQVWQNFNAYKSRYGIPDIITDGLILNLDAGNPYSYLSGSSGTTWTDVSGQGNNGTLTNGASYANGAISFDGVDDYAVFGDILDLGTNDMTINCWFKINPSSTYINYLVSKAFYGGQNYRYGFYIWDKKIGGFMQGNGGPDVEKKSTTVLSSNTWYMGTIVFNRASSYKIYVNCVEQTLDGDSTISQWDGLDFQSNNPFKVGSYNYSDNISSNFFFDGKIAVTQVYFRALTASEITQNFNALRGRYGI